jgi:outer membrane protein insertion porin family
MKRFLTVLFYLGLLLPTLTYGQFRKSRERSVETPPPPTENLNYANPVEYYIGGIDVTGLNVLDKNAIISLTGLRVGDKVKIPGDKISSAVRKLWKHGLVGDVSILVDRVEGQNVFLNIHLSERPRLTDFFFVGISKGRQSGLKEDLNLIKGKIVNDAMVRNAELAVKKHFVKKGFLNTEVKIVPVTDTLSRGNARLRINVDLKSKVKINEITFEGNENISSGKLKSQLKKTHEYPRMSLHRALIYGLFHLKADSVNKMNWRQLKENLNRHVKLNVFKGSKFIRTEYEEDKVKLIDYYNTQGYRDAEILTDTIYAHSDKTINVHLKISEGRKYYFRNIYWTGNYKYSTNTLNKVLDIQKGDVYNNELITKKTSFNPKGADISGLYMDDGYLFFHVEAVEVAVEGDSIDLEMRIFEGDQAIVNQVLISGNTTTSDHVIRRELSTVPGQKFRRSDIIRTQQQLSQMGYFNPQKIEQEIRPNPSEGTVDIEWKVEEQSNDQIQLSGGWGGYYGFVGTLGFSFNNFSARNLTHFDKWRPLPRGDGQKVSISAQANGKSFQSYNFSFTEPWLGGRKPNSLTVSLNHSISRSIYGYATSDLSNSPSIRQSGVTVGLGRRLEWPDNYFTLVNSLSFLVYNYKNYFAGSTVLPSIGTTYDLGLETTLARNSIDNPMYPTSGSTISLSLKLTPPYSQWRNSDYYSDINDRYKWVEMHKWMFDSKFYLKLFGSNKPEGRSLVLETKAHFGFIGSYTQGLQPGPFGRYLMGGSGLAGGINSFVLGQEIISMRGYNDRVLTPPGYNTSSSGNTSSDIQGGIVYNKFGLELRYPVTTGQTATIYGYLFAEGGNNWNNFYDFNPFRIYKTTGFGARIFMPAFGLIGLSWGKAFDAVPFGNPDKSAGKQSFQFTIGQQIR